MNGERVFVALSVVFALGIFATGVAAQGAPDDPEGGFVIPGSKAGVNPAYHPEYFGSPPNLACFDRFETYDSSSETYLGTDGHRHPCRRSASQNSVHSTHHSRKAAR
jgi:hypothetical protein